MTTPTLTPPCCPDCGERWEQPGGFTRLIGIVDQDRDRCVEWLCPDCGHRWPRGHAPWETAR